MRLYCIAAIAVLAVVLSAGSVAWSANGSTYVSDNIPAAMTVGVTYTPTVTMQNTGDTTWTDSPADYNFGCPDGSANGYWDGRKDVGGSIAPTQSKTFTLSLTPNRTGTFVCHWQMVQEAVEWFGAVVEKTITVELPGGGQGTQTPYNGVIQLPAYIQCEDYDVGGQYISYFDYDTGNNGGAYRSDDVDIENTGDIGGGYNIGWIGGGEWWEYTVNATAGIYPVRLRAASPGGGWFHVEVDGADVTGSVAVPATGGWQTYTTVSAPDITLTDGQHIICLMSNGGELNLNWLEIGNAPPPPTNPDTIWGQETFSYGAGSTLNGNVAQIPGEGWKIQEGANTDAMTIVAGGVSGNCLRNWFKPGNQRLNITDGSFGPSWNIEAAPYSKKIKLSFKIKPVTTVGDNFWQMCMRDWVGTTSRTYIFLQGSDSNIKAFDAYENSGDKVGLGSTEQPISAGSWHQVDCVIDYKEPSSNNIVYYFLDGRYFWTGKSDGGRTNTNRVRSVDLIQLASACTEEMQVLIDDITLGSSSLPVNVITQPIENDVTGATPTIRWTRTWPWEQVEAVQVVVCTSNDPNSTPAWDSGDVEPGFITELVTGELPPSVDLWVFQRDKLTTGAYNPWSAGVKFSVLDPNCSIPTVVTSPTGTIATKKPMITVTGCPHTHLQVGVARNSNGSDPVYDSGDITTTGNGYATAALDPGTYYAFGRVGVVVDSVVVWKPWSSGQQFTIDLAGQIADIRHMHEENILTTDTDYPNDGFGRIFMSGQYQDGEGTSTTVSQTTPVCGNVGLFWNDRGASRSLRVHKIGTTSNFGNIDLDNGVTVLWAVSVLAEGGSDAQGSSWRMATNLVIDKNTSGEDYFIAIRTLPSGVGLITETAYGNEPFGSGWGHHWHGWAESTDYRILRLTGRNTVAGDFNSTVWKLYINEASSPVLTVNGCLRGSIMEGFTPDRAQGFVTDEVCIGHGSAGSTGDIVFDWIAVNGTCDYAPGEWSPFGGGGGGGSFSGIGAAKAAGAEASPVSISWAAPGSGVITKVITHEELQGDPPAPVIVQDGFYAQDTATNNAVSGIFVATSDTKEGAVIPGATLAGLSGVMVERSVVGAEQTIGGRAIVNPTFTVQGSASYPPMGIAQKSLMNACIDQNLGSSLDTMSMYVRIFGKVTLASFTGGGLPYFYVDDGSGAIDDREVAAGMRVVLPIDAEVIPTVGDYVMVEGWSAYEIASGGTYTNVRTLVYPTATILTMGLP